MTSGDQTRALLSAFLTAEARAAVVRIRDLTMGSSAVFSGFFVSPEGHLITAFHAVKAHAFDLPCTFEVQIEFDVPPAGSTGSRLAVTTTAQCEPGWCDPRADWAVLRLGLRPDTFLPVGTAYVLERSGDALCAELRVYGFTATEQGVPCLGALSGEYLRPVPEKRRFHVAFSVRSRGQSGGPVIDMRSHAVVGSVVGYRQDEQLTADIAAIDQDTLAPIGLDLPVLARRWRIRAATHLCANHPEFAMVTADQFVPSLPDRHLSHRALAHQIRTPLLGRRQSVAFLHGPPGSGKSVLALETAHTLCEQGVAGSLFWHDFEPHQHRSTDHLIRRLAVHVLHHDEILEPLQACLAADFVRDRSAAANALIAALRHGRHVLVFDNLHCISREDRVEMSALLDQISAAAQRSGSVVIFTSWDRPRAPLDQALHDVEGLTRQEVLRLLDVHQVEISSSALDLVCQFATDITCVEAFLRSPSWRAEVEAGHPQPAEPAELHRYWLDRFLGPVPEAGRRVLLALAVLAQPAPRDLLEEVAETRNFAATLEQLLTSPPLVRTDSDRFYVHFNVARAILATSDRDAIAAAHNRASTAHLRRGDYVTTARHHMNAGNTGTALDLLFRTRDSIIAAGRIQDLETLVEHIRRLTRDRHDAAHQVHAILASCRSMRGEYATATRHWNFALQHLRGGPEAAALHNRKGDSHRLASDYQAAGEEYEKATVLAREHDSVESLRELGRAQLGLAKLNRLRCAYFQARHHYAQAREAFEALFDDVGLIEADFGLGEVSRLMEQWDAAMNSYQVSLVRARDNANLERAAYALWGIGEVQRLSGAHAQAQQTHQEGLDLCVEVGDTRSEGWALLGIAESSRMDNDAECLEFYRQARSKFERTGSKTEIAHAMLGTAEALRSRGEIELTLYQQALDTYQAKGLRHCVVICRLSYSAALRSFQQVSQANDHLDRAHEIASTCSLWPELERIDLMRRDSSSSPFLPLNFP